MLRIGQLRSHFMIQRRQTVRNSIGEQVQNWTRIGDVWGMLEPLSGRELEAASALRAETMYRITIRYFPGLTAADRIVYVDPEGATHLYNLTAVLDLEGRHRVQICTASEGLSPG